MNDYRGRLSPAAKELIALLERNPVPRCEVNPGLRASLVKLGLIEVVDLPSPFKTSAGQLIPHVRLLSRAGGSS